MSSKKKLIENFLSLAVVQGLNYVLPLLTIPYLVRILGPERLGLTAFSLSFVQFLIIVTDYGFNLSATKEISISREDTRKISRIFSAVISIKFLLLLVSLIILLLTVTFIPKFKVDYSLYVLTFTLVIGQAAFPIWFFQGMERMKFITFLSIFSKSLYAISIFVFIDDKSDYLLVNFLNGISVMVVSIISLYFVYYKFGIRYHLPRLDEIIYQIKDGWHVFISTIAVSLYTVSNIFLLGIFTNNTVVGYYAGAEKVISAFNGLINPLAQTIYPHINRLVNDSKQKALHFISKVFKVVGISSLIFSLLLFFMADSIVKYILGNGYDQSVIVLKILAPLPLLISASNILGVQTMVTFNFKKAFSNILITASITNIFFSILLVPQYQYIGTAISVLSSELIVTILMYRYLSLKGIKMLEGIYYNV